MFKNSHQILRWLGALTVLLGTATSSFAQNTFGTATDLTGVMPTNGANYDFVGGTTTAGGFTNDFTTSSSPGSATAQASNDVFYKVHTNGCADKITISTCGLLTNFDTYIHLLDATGVELASNDNSTIASCVATAIGESGLEFIVTGGTDYYIVVEGAGTASGDFTLNIMQQDLVPLVATATANTTAISANACAGNLVTFGSTPSGMASYAWTAAIGAFTSSAQNPTIASAASANSDLYQVQVTDAGGCTATADVFLNVLDPTVVDAGPDNALCKNGGNFSVTGTVTNGATATWTHNGGGTLSSATWDGLGQSYTPGGADLTGVFPKTITITLTSDPVSGCPGVTDNLILTLYQCPSLTTTTTSVCPSGPVDLTTRVTDANSTVGTTTWYPTQADAQAQTNALVVTTVNPATATTYWVRKNTTTTPECTDIKSVLIGMLPVPAQTLTPATQAICSGSAIAPIDITPAIASTTYTNVLAGAVNRGVYMDFTNNTASTMTITSIGMTIQTAANGVTNPSYRIYSTTATGSAAASYTTAANWTTNVTQGYILTAAQATAGGAFNVTIPLVVPITIPAGQTRGVYAVGLQTTSNLQYRSGAATVASIGDANLTITSRNSSGGLFLASGLNRGFSGSVTYTGTSTAWTRNNLVNVTGTGTGSLATGTIFPINAALTNITSTAQTTVYTMTTTGSNGCTSTSSAAVTVNVPATVNPGLSQQICSGSTATLAGSFGGAATTAIWTTAGTGTFASSGTGTSTVLNDVYTPSAADIAAGLAVLTLTTDVPTGCTAATGSVTISISTAPTAANFTVCQGATVAAGTGMGATGSICGPVVIGPFAGSLTSTDLQWVRPNVVSATGSSAISPTLPTGAGVNGTAVYYDTYTFVAPLTGTYTFVGNSGGLDGFGILYSGVFNPLTPLVNAVQGGDDTGGAPYNNDPTITFALVGGQSYTYVMTSWDNNAQGNYNIALTASPSGTMGWYTAATGGTQIGSGATFNPVGVAGSGIASTATPGTTTFYAGCGGAPCRTPVTFTIAAGATANAGLDGSTCANAGFVLSSAAIGGSATTGTWTTSGTGTFDNASNVNALYTPSVADAAAGTVTLTLTATDPAGVAPCNTQNDAMVLTVKPIPVVTPFAVCQNGTVGAGMGLQSSCAAGLTDAFTATVNFNVTAQPTEVTSTLATFAGPFGTIGTGTMAALPAGAVVTGATLTYNGITALGASWQSDVHIGLSGAGTAVPTVSTPFVGNTTGDIAGLFNFTRTIPAATIPVAGGAFTLTYWDAFNDNAADESTYPTGATAATMTINYTLPATPKWFAVATGGVSLATGTTFDPTTAGYNTATPGTTTFYAECGMTGCRTPVDFTVNTAVVAPVLAGATYCQGAVAAALNATATGGVSYLWNDAAASTTASITPLTTTVATTTYTVTITGAATCPTATASATIVVNAPLVAPVLSGATYCIGAVATALDATTTNATAYAWSDATTAATLTPLTAAAGSTTYTVTVSAPATNCPAVTASAVIVVNTPVTAPVLAGATYCQDLPAAALDATVANAVSYLWSNAAVTASITPLTTAAGTTTYTVTVTGAAGCPTATASAVIVVSPKPTNTLTPATQAICSGSPIAPIGFTPAAIGFNPTTMNIAPAATASTTRNRGIYFNLTNTSATTPLVITSFTQDLGVNVAGVAPTDRFDVYVTNPGIATYAGNTAVPANWSVIGTRSAAAYTSTLGAGAYYPNQNIPITAPTGFILAPGESRGFLIAGNTANQAVFYMAGTYNIPANPTTTVQGPLTYTRGAATSALLAGGLFTPRHAYGGVNWNTTGSTFSWTRDNLVNVTGTGLGSGAGPSSVFPITANLTNTTTIAQTTVYTVTATGSNACTATFSAAVTINVPATVNAGISQSICAGATATMAGSFGGAATLATWTTSGTGTFDNTTSMTAVYTPSAADIAAGSVVLTLTTDVPAGGGACTAAAKSITLTINSFPTVTNFSTCQNATVGAGMGMSAVGGCGTVALGPFVGDLTATDPIFARAEVAAATGSSTVTAVAPVAPNGTAVYYDTYTFTAPITGSYTFTGNSAGLDGFGFLYNGSFNPLTPQVNAIAGSDDTGGTPYNNDPIITANLVGGQTYVYVMTSWNNAALGAYTINVAAPAGNLTWFTAATGGTQIGAGATFNPVGVAGSGITNTATPAVTTFYVGCNGSNCRTPVTFTVAPGATANAGVDGVVCANSTFALSSAAIGGSATTAAWTTSGTGTFDNASNVNAVYTPSAADAALGSVTLTLTGTDPVGAAPCNVGVDAMLLNITPVPTTVPFAVCQNATVGAGQGVSITSTCANPQTVTVTFNVAAVPNNDGGTTVATAPLPVSISTAVMAALPAGSTVTGAVLSANNITNLSTNFQNHILLGVADGAGTLLAPVAQGTGALGTNASPFNYTTTIPAAAIPVAGGTLNLAYSNITNDIIGGDCSFTTATLTITYTNSTASWYAGAVGGAALATGTTFNPIGVAGSGLANTATPGTTTYYVECAGAGGCRSSVDFTVSPAVVAPVLAGATYCQGAVAAALDATATGGLTYLWNDAAASTTASITPLTTTAGSTTYTVTITGAAACATATASAVIVVNAAPIVAAVATPVTCNAGSTGSVTANITPAASPFTFDGNITEAAWGAPLATSAGGPAPGFGPNNNLNALYSTGDGVNTYIGIAGKIDPGNYMMVFIDSKPGGFTNGAYNKANAPGGANSFNAGSTFDAGFAPDYCLVVNTTGGANHYVDLFTLASTAAAGTNNYLGNPGAGATNIGANLSYSSLTQGYEIAIPNSALGGGSGSVKMFAMLMGGGGYLSNLFMTPAGAGDGNYASGPVDFNTATPNPVTTPAAAAPQYVWNTGATTQTLTGVPAGTYTVTVTGSNGCTSTATAIVTEPAAITYTVASTNVLCGTPPTLGTITVSAAAGGTGAYQYSINNGTTYVASGAFTGLIANSYTVIVKDAAGCTSTTTPIAITQPVTITPTFTGGTTICNNGASVTLSATGGNTYDFGAGAGAAATYVVTPTMTMTYTVTVSDAASSCSATATQTIVVNPLPALTATSTAATTCLAPFDGAIDLGVTAAVPAVAVDGTIEAAWGMPLVTDAGGPTSLGFGSDLTLNALYANNDGTNTNIALKGKFHWGGNSYLIFIDSKAGGVNGGSYDRTNAPTGLDSFTGGNTFDAGFLPDYAVAINNVGNGTSYTADLFKLGAAGVNTPLTAAQFAVASWSGSAQDFELQIPNSALGYTSGAMQFFAMLQGGGGYLSNQFLSPAGAADGNYTNAVINFATSAPNPVTLPAANTITYLWSNGATTQDLTGIAAGTYTVTVTSPNSCTTTTQVVVGSNNTAPATLVVLPSTVGAITLVQGCTDATGWTYYANPSNTTQMMFAIKWDPTNIGGTHNMAAKAASSVTITLDAAMTEANGALDRTVAMKRYWNVDGAPALDGPVNVKFFYDAAEALAAKDRAGVSNTLPAATPTQLPSHYEGFEWFKSVGAPYTPACVLSSSPNGCGMLQLTDVNAATALVENGVLYAQFDAIPSFSGGTGAAGWGPFGSPLPVKLLSFTGAINGKVNDLTWKTATEQNVATFIVERSADGNDFKEIGRVAPTNTAVQHTYNFTDANPTVRAYYRLRMVDNDGTTEFSNTITLLRRTGEFNVAAVYPNPTNGIVNVEYDVTTPTTVNFVVIDVLGRVVTTVKTNATAGFNVQKIDLADFASGVYTIIMDKGTNERVVRKIVKE
jgi:Secretion system C-terminal sorting domain/Ig-like domain CHU_C associated/PKD-like domain